MKSRKFKSFLFLVVLFTAVTFSCDDSMPDPIYGTKPTVSFTATQSASDVFTWSFTNNTSGAVSYNWDFGDGNGSSDANPSHTYSGAGSFTVTLTATAAGTSNSMGWRQSSSQAVQIDLPTYEKAMVTFSVDVSNEGVTSADKVHLTGNFLDWCEACKEMSDADGDGVYTVEVELETNKDYEYKFQINNWGKAENFEPGGSCTVTDPSGQYTNRAFSLGNLSATADAGVYCWNTCEETCAQCVEEDGFSTTVGSINLTASSDKNWKDGGDLWEQFGNIQSAQVENPALGEGNMSCMVNKLWDEDQVCEGWAGYGFRIGENCADPGPVCPDNILDFATSTKKKFKMKAYGPVGSVIILKLEFNPYPNTSPAVERKLILSKDNEWEDLVFDFSSETSGTYANMLVYTYNKDVDGSACGGQVIYVDDLVQSE